MLSSPLLSPLSYPLSSPLQFNGAITAWALSLDGALDWLGSALGETTTPLISGLSTSETEFTLSAWLNFAGKGAQEQILSIATSTTNRLSIFSNASGNLGIITITSAGTTTLNIADTGAQIANDPGGGGLPAIQWYHLYMTYNGTDLAVYVNGSSAYSSSAGIGGYQGDLPFRIGARGSAATNKYLGLMSQFWFHDVYLDAATNISKFYVNIATGKNLGADGSLPTGSAPRVFLPFSNAANIGSNSGTGGDLPLNGAPTQTTGIMVA